MLLLLNESLFVQVFRLNKCNSTEKLFLLNPGKTSSQPIIIFLKTKLKNEENIFIDLIL